MESPRRTILIILAAILLVLEDHAAHAVTTTFDLDGNGVPESNATSTVTPAFGFGIGVCTPCTITHSVSNGIAAAQSFTWTGPGFTARVPGFGTATSTFTTHRSVVEDTGNIAFNPSGVGGTANYDKPVISAILYFAGDLISKFSKSPTHIEFKSSLTNLGSSSYRYTYSVTNLDGSPTSFTWAAGGLSGTVDGFDVMTTSFVSSLPAQEFDGSASFEIDGDSISMPANVWVPVDQPPVANKCERTKLRAAGKKFACAFSCYAKGAGKGEGPDPDCLTGCDEKFSDTFDAAESNGGCATVADKDDIGGRVDAYVKDVSAALQ